MDEIKQGKEENPDQVDKVPVQTCIFVHDEFILTHPSFMDIHDDPGKENHPDNNMQGMQTGHDEVQSEKHGVAMAQLVQEFGTRIQTVFEFDSPFEIFIHKEPDPQG